MSKIHYGEDKPACGKGFHNVRTTTIMKNVECRHCLYLLGYTDIYSRYEHHMTLKQELKEFKCFMGQYYEGWG